jgi:hypothetical protein
MTVELYCLAFRFQVSKLRDNALAILPTEYAPSVRCLVRIFTAEELIDGGYAFRQYCADMYYRRYSHYIPKPPDSLKYPWYFFELFHQKALEGIGEERRAQTVNVESS